MQLLGFVKWGGGVVSPTMVHLRSPALTEPQIQWFSLALVDGGTPHVCSNASKERIEKVPKRSPTEKLILGAFVGFFKEHVRSGVG